MATEKTLLKPDAVGLAPHPNQAAPPRRAKRHHRANRPRHAARSGTWHDFSSSCRPVVLRRFREDDKTTRRQGDRSRASSGFAGGRRARQADLRQPPRPRHGKPPRIFWRSRISPKAIHPYLQYALRKLEILYYLAKRQHGSKANRGPSGRPESPTRSRRFRWTRRNSAGGCTGSTAN